MSEEDKVRLRSYYAKRGRPRKGTLNGKETPSLCEKIKKLGAKKTAIKLYEEKRKGKEVIVLRDITENAIRSWITRGTVPFEYHGVVSAL